MYLSFVQFQHHLHSLCCWGRSSSCQVLASSLMDLLKTSSSVYIDSTPCSHIPWQRPRPSVAAYRIVSCLNLLGWCRGWAWTNDFLIGKQLWPVLQAWNGRDKEGGASLVKEAVVVCVLRLIG